MATTWLRLTSQTAIVTGAASGIGRATAIAFAEQGCNVLLCDARPEKLDEVARACVEAADRDILVRPSPCNVTDKSQVRDAIASADEMASSSAGMSPSSPSSPPPVASVLVNCAGITRDGRASDLSDEDWDDVLDVNLKGTFLTCRAFCAPERLPGLLLGRRRRRGGNGFDSASSSSIGDGSRNRSGFGIGGSIINVGSIVSTYGNYGQANYAASKGGVVGLTRSLAKEMAAISYKATRAAVDDGIGDEGMADEDADAEEEERIPIPPTVRVNCIQPGFIRTPMANAVPRKVLSDMTRKIALRRLGRAEDVANMALFLASSERSGYVTGEAFECSGMLRL